MTATPLNIGWIGLGKMGLPICRRLKAAGHSVTALVRGAAGRDRAAEHQLASAETITALAADADVVFSAISDDAALTDIVLGPRALASCLRPQQIFIDLSTVSPLVSQSVATHLEGKQVPYLRAPVSGSTGMAEAGTLTTMVSGPREAFDRLKPVLCLYTRHQFYLGDGEAARHLKLAINMMVGATSAVLAEALTFGRKGGLDVATMLEVICQSAVASPLIDYKRKMLVEEDFQSAFSLSQIIKDYDILLATGRIGHCPLPLTAQIRAQFEGARARGHGEKDFFVMAADAANLAGLKP